MWAARGSRGELLWPQMQSNSGMKPVGSCQAGRRLGYSWIPWGLTFWSSGGISHLALKRDLSGDPTGALWPWDGHMAEGTDGGGSLAPGWASARRLPSSSLPGRGKKMKLETPQPAAFWIFFSVGEKEKRPRSWKSQANSGPWRNCCPSLPLGLGWAPPEGPHWSRAEKYTKPVMLHLLKNPSPVTWQWPESHGHSCWPRWEAPTLYPPCLTRSCRPSLSSALGRFPLDLPQSLPSRLPTTSGHQPSPPIYELKALNALGYLQFNKTKLRMLPREIIHTMGWRFI